MAVLAGDLERELGRSGILRHLDREAKQPWSGLAGSSAGRGGWNTTLARQLSAVTPVPFTSPISISSETWSGNDVIAWMFQVKFRTASALTDAGDTMFWMT